MAAGWEEVARAGNLQVAAVMAVGVRAVVVSVVASDVVLLVEAAMAAVARAGEPKAQNVATMEEARAGVGLAASRAGVVGIGKMAAAAMVEAREAAGLAGEVTAAV